MFDYTGKIVILSVDDFSKAINNEIKHVKNLKGGGKWLVNPNFEYKIYSDDPIIKITGIGKVTSQKFKEYGINTVLELRNLSDEATEKMNEFNGDEVKKVKDIAQESLKNRALDQMSRPTKIDHRKAANPYLSSLVITGCRKSRNLHSFQSIVIFVTL